MTAPLRSDPTIVRVALDARSYDIVIGRGVIGSLGAAHRRPSSWREDRDRHRRRSRAPSSRRRRSLAGCGRRPGEPRDRSGRRGLEELSQLRTGLRGADRRTHRARRSRCRARRRRDRRSRRLCRVHRAPRHRFRAGADDAAGAGRFSVGGKTAINSAHGKNLIGAFHQPILVVADTAVLDTLPPRQFRAGYAEVVKYGLLGDAAFFTWLEANWRDVFAGGSASGSLRANTPSP